MYQEGEINIIKCDSCGEEFPDFIFVADTDMVTYGCLSLTNKNKEIALTLAGEAESIKDVEERIGQGFHVLEVEYEDRTPSTKGQSFQDFLKTYKPPLPIYHCIYCHSKAFVNRTETKDQFLSHGVIRVFEDS